MVAHGNATRCLFHNAERQIKATLAAQFRPLEVCQRRYELRLERDGGSFSDLVQRKLEQELEALGDQVGRQDLVKCSRATTQMRLYHSLRAHCCFVVLCG